MTTPDRSPQPKMLDLDLLLDRPLVRIDGVDYEMLSPDELPELVFRRLNKIGARLQAIEEIADPTPDDEAEHDRLLDTICRRVLLAPDEVHARLKHGHREAVVLAFTRLRLATIRRSAGATATTADRATDPATTGAI